MQSVNVMLAEAAPCWKRLNWQLLKREAGLYVCSQASARVGESTGGHWELGVKDRKIGLEKQEPQKKAGKWLYDKVFCMLYIISIIKVLQ